MLVNDASNRHLIENDKESLYFHCISKYDEIGGATHISAFFF